MFPSGDSKGTTNISVFELFQLFHRVFLPFSFVFICILLIVVFMIRKVHWSIWIAQIAIGVFVGVRWLSRNIMYISTNRIFNRQCLRDETNWFRRVIFRGLGLISTGVHHLRNGHSDAVSSLEAGRKLFNDIRFILGNDLPVSKLPLLEAINKLLDACTHYATESQLSHIEVCIQHVEETVDSLVYVSPPFTNFIAFIRHPKLWKNIWYFISPSNHFFVTFPMLQRKLIHQNDAKVYHLVAADGSHMTSILFFPTHHTENSDQLILLASPNACISEISYISDASVQFYTSRGYHVAVYNYRGCGDTSGTVTPENTARDAEMIIQTLCTEYKLHFTVVHGTSIGGYVVGYLRASPEPFRIYDRTFSDMNSLVEQFVPRPLPFLVRVCRRWPMKVADKIDVSIPSLLLFDPRDEIVVFPASLLFGLTCRYYKQDPATIKLENALREEYKECVKSIQNCLKKELASFDEVWELCTSLSSTSIFSSKVISNSRKLLLLSLQMEILGFPFIDVISPDLNGEESNEDFLVMFITTWRKRVVNLHSQYYSIDKVINIFEEPEFKFENEDPDLLQIWKTMVTIRDFCEQANSFIPETFHVMAIHCSHNGCLAREEYEYIDSLLES
ncbi:hypothetical protein WA171_001671 [Blastocystis sp. BT1]